MTPKENPSKQNNTRSTRYTIHFNILCEGVCEKHDLVGAVFGQTENLLSKELNLRSLYRYGKIGHLNANLQTKDGKTEGKLYFTASLSKIDLATIVATIESIDRIGVSPTKIILEEIKNHYQEKMGSIIARANEIFEKMGGDIAGQIQSKQILDKNIEGRIIYRNNIYQGDQYENSSLVYVVEGKSDLSALGRADIFNTIAIVEVREDKLKEEFKNKSLILFFDGDHAGYLHQEKIINMFKDKVSFIVNSRQEISVADMPPMLIIRLLKKKKRLEEHLNKENNFHITEWNNIEEDPSLKQKIIQFLKDNLVIAVKKDMSIVTFTKNNFEQGLATENGERYLFVITNSKFGQRFRFSCYKLGVDKVIIYDTQKNSYSLNKIK